MYIRKGGLLKIAKANKGGGRPPESATGYFQWISFYSYVASTGIIHNVVES